ncbi:MAG TPA: hypothetical protein VK445_06835, partial [Dissulfurispiraceae bacterium]|nr:hypothetical protein [Dissulfurispiraceae bacterium]
RLWPSAEVVARLEAIVEHGGLKPAEIEARQAASLSLATVGAPSSLGVFERVLRSKNLFRHSSLQIVKFGIIDALGQYTGTGARGLLSRIKSFGNKDLAQKAESVETSICEKTYAS